jgi:hypothetical protein
VNLSRSPDRRRVVALVVLACLALGSAAGLAGGLVSCAAPGPRGTPVRPLSAPESQRLAAMRLTNLQDARAGLRATYGRGADEVRLTGWIDWGRALTYLRVDGPGAGAQRGLLQALPGVKATRPPAATEPPADAYAAPPARPPADGWRVGQWSAAGKDRTTLDAFLALVFMLAADRRDAAEVLRASDARWLGTEKIAGTPMDVLMGPAVPPPAPLAAPTPSAPASTIRPGRAAEATTAATVRANPAAVPSVMAQMGGAVRYWLDGTARLHRFEALLPGDRSVRVDLDRADRSPIAAVDALGGDPVQPRAVTAAEAKLLAGMLRRNLSRGGGAVALTLPTVPAANLRGTGWVDWRTGVAYLSVRDLDDPRKARLLRATRAGVAARPAPAGAADRPKPPLPPPGGGSWTYADWSRRMDSRGAPDLDLLLGELTALGAEARGDAARLRGRSSWLRADEVGGVPVTVFEILKPAERGIQRGQARLRYWVDRQGGLRRLEVRTRAGGFTQLDVTPGDAPALPAVPAGAP